MSRRGPAASTACLCSFHKAAKLGSATRGARRRRADSCPLRRSSSRSHVVSSDWRRLVLMLFQQRGLRVLNSMTTLIDIKRGWDLIQCASCRWCGAAGLTRLRLGSGFVVDSLGPPRAIARRPSLALRFSRKGEEHQRRTTHAHPLHVIFLLI